MNTTPKRRPTLRVVLIIAAAILTLSGDFLTAGAIFGLIWWLGKRAKENATDDMTLPSVQPEYYTPTPVAPVDDQTPPRMSPEQKYAIPTQRNHG